MSRMKYLLQRESYLNKLTAYFQKGQRCTGSSAEKNYQNNMGEKSSISKRKVKKFAGFRLVQQKLARKKKRKKENPRQ